MSTFGRMTRLRRIKRGPPVLPAMLEHRFFAPVLLLIASVLWSLGGVLIKLIDWHPLAIAGMRSAIAVPLILICTGWPQFTFSRAQIGGAIAYASTVILFVLATRTTTAANAIFLQYTAPIYVAALGPWWLGERTRAIDWLMIGVALGGIGLFFLDQLTLTGFWGNIWALGSGLSFACMALCLRQEKGGSPATALLLGNIVAAVIGLPFVLTSPPPSGVWLPLLVLGTVQLGLPYVLYSIAIQRVTALEASLIPLLEPVLNPLFVLWMLGERPGPWATVGAGVVLGAVLVRGVMIAVTRPTGTAAASHS